MDGEGCITRSNGRPIVQIGMTDENTMRWLHETIGGNMRIEILKPPRKPLYRWRLLAQSEVLRFLWAVVPFMRTRRYPAEEAILAIQGSRYAAGLEMML